MADIHGATANGKSLESAVFRLKPSGLIAIVGLVAWVGYSAMEVWVWTIAENPSLETLETVIAIEDAGPGLMIATAVAFIVWSYFAHANLDVFERHDQSHQNSATIWWWICPIANLWMPFRVMFETTRGSMAPRGPGWKDTRLPVVAPAWAGTFIVGMIATRATTAAINSATTVGDLETALNWNAAAFGVLGMAAALAIMLVWQVTRAQEALAESWSTGSVAAPETARSGSRKEPTPHSGQTTEPATADARIPRTPAQNQARASELVALMRQARSKQQFRYLLGEVVDVEEAMEDRDQTAERDRFREQWVGAAKDSICREVFDGDTRAFGDAVSKAGRRQHGAAFSEDIIATANDPDLVVRLLGEAALLQPVDEDPHSPSPTTATTTETADHSLGDGTTELFSDEINDPVAARLRRIDRLLAGGVITQDEYDEKRTEILSDL